MNSNTPSNNSGNVIVRPPVVVVLGHVDHGKTTLLDAIRKTNVVGGESGGITQHIGAYQVETHGRLITFLDTPGHEAFTAIRSRGAKVADVAILVVAADESVKPQTVEAIRIIKDANLPVVVAINKADKPGANVQKAKQDLAQHDILVEDWGGQVPAVATAAKSSMGIPELLDMVLLVADLGGLQASTNAATNGVVIESHKDPRRGFVATILVREGMLRVGDWVVAGHVVGKLKSMEDFNETPVDVAGPSMPVAVTGWLEAPPVGAALHTAPSKRAAEELAADSVVPPPPAFDTFRKTADESDERPTLNALFKADVSSSLEALERSVAAIPQEQVVLRVLSSGIGTITEADVKTAAAKGAVIFGFNVDVDAPATKLAERDGISIRTSPVIYEIVEAVRKEMERLLPSKTERMVTGKLRVLAIFKTDARSIILGGKVTTGTVQKGALVDLIRDDIPIRVGKITSLQQEKEDVDEAATGVECGMRIDTSAFDGDIQEGDVLEFVTEAEVQQTLG